MTTFTPQHLIQNWIETDPGVIQPGGFVRYDPGTGEILEVGLMATAFIANHQSEGRPYLNASGIAIDNQLEFLAANYVDLATNEIKPKADFTGVLNGTVITELPVPCRIRVRTPFQPGRHDWWAPQDFDWSDPDIELVFNTPDTYLVTVESAFQKTGEFRVPVDA